MKNSPSFWNDVKQAGIIGKEKTKITNLLKNYENAFNALNDASELFDLANSENDTETLEALFNDAPKLEDTITSLEISMLLSGKMMVKMPLFPFTQVRVERKVMTGQACFIGCI